MIGQSALGTNQANLAKSLEKLSTGLRINRASDDAAGNDALGGAKQFVVT